MSGDGLVHEAINSLMKRKDFYLCENLLIGVLPGGTSSALVVNINI